VAGEGVPVNAADVLADAWPTVDGADDFVAALLAHGEQGMGVTIRASDHELIPWEPLTEAERADFRQLVAMVEPLDPDTLARLDRALEGRHLSPNALVPRSKLAALLAVARDHARLKAEIAKWGLPSAEAGDTDGD
jgi:hypothetical protein